MLPPPTQELLSGVAGTQKPGAPTEVRPAPAAGLGHALAPASFHNALAWLCPTPLAARAAGLLPCAGHPPSQADPRQSPRTWSGGVGEAANVFSCTRLPPASEGGGGCPQGGLCPVLQPAANSSGQAVHSGPASPCVRIAGPLMRPAAAGPGARAAPDGSGRARGFPSLALTLKAASWDNFHLVNFPLSLMPLCPPGARGCPASPPSPCTAPGGTRPLPGISGPASHFPPP